MQLLDRIREISDRAREIILRPENEWAAIAGHPADINSLMYGYVAFLAAVPAVAGFVGNWMVGYGNKLSFFGALLFAVIGYLASLLVVFAISWCAERFAPKFRADVSDHSAAKIAAYAMTPAWLAGVFTAVPALSLLSLVGAAYALYLTWLGVQALMRVDKEKAISYTCMIMLPPAALGLLLTRIAGAIVGSGRMF